MIHTEIYGNNACPGESLIRHNVFYHIWDLMRFAAFLSLALFLLPSVAFADPPENTKVEENQLYQIYFFNSTVGKDFILLEKLMVQDSKFYVSADWAIRQFGLDWDIADTNTLLLSRSRMETSNKRNALPWADHEMSITIEGKAFTDFIPSETRNPIQSYVDLEAFTRATGNTYAFSSKTQVMHIRVEGAVGQEKPVEPTPSTCHEWIRRFGEAQAEHTPNPLDRKSTRLNSSHRC